MTLQNIYLKICEYFPFTSMNVREKENSKLKMFKHFMLGPQNGQNGFWLRQRKNVNIFASGAILKNVK